MGGNQEIMNELISKQRQNVPNNRKLSYTDLKRIAKNVNHSIFTGNECNIWTGYVTKKPNNKGTYVNFYFNKKKLALHRLLFINFVDDLKNDEYLKYTCDNKGTCCNINHLQKHKYEKDNKVIIIKKDKPEEKIIDNKNYEEQDSLILSFD